MKRGINLYHSSLQPARVLLTSARLLVVLLAVLLLGGLTRGGYEFAMHQLGKQHQAALAEQQNLNTRIAELAAQLNRQRPLRSLLNQTEQVKLEVATRKALLDEFERRGKIRRDNLSPVLQELSNIHINGVWITRVSIQPEGVELEGQTNSAKLIPRWMAKFSETSTLSKHRFTVVELRKEQHNLLNFALLSKPVNGALAQPIFETAEGIKVDETVIP